MRDRLKALIDDLGIDIILTEAEKQHIADYLINSGVIVPPARVGQTVYIIGWDYDIEEFTVKDVAYLEDEIGEYYYRYRAVMRRQSDIHFTDIYIGESVFLTREEAEKALERSKNENKRKNRIW